MSLIKPRTRGRQRVQHRTRLDRENHETLYAYAAFINEDSEYVLNELIDTVLARDKDYMKWRAEHSESFAPRGVAARARQRPVARDAATARASASGLGDARV
ncbi:MAG TPA: hypothetical protein VJM31_04255 [Vicinamibacterales bacterium]|nr:hypothetical protein [Vicinamibacterales bacterium]